jgi:hypothetical protein
MTLFWKCSPEFAHCIVPFYTAPAAPLHKKVFELEKTIDTPNYAHCRTTGNVTKKNCLHNVVVFCFLVVRSYCAFSLGNWISTLTVAIISNLKISIDSYTTGNSPPDANTEPLTVNDPSNVIGGCGSAPFSWIDTKSQFNYGYSAWIIN